MAAKDFVAGLLKEKGGLEQFYNDESTKKLFRNTYGIELPPFNKEVAERFIEEIVAKVSNHGPLTRLNTPDVEKVNEAFATKVGENGPTMGQEYGVDNMKGLIQRMESSSNPYAKGSLTRFNAKEMTRFPLFLASSLCRYHGVSSEITNTNERLDKLAELAVLSENEASVLKAGFEFSAISG